MTVVHSDLCSSARNTALCWEPLCPTTVSAPGAASRRWIAVSLGEWGGGSCSARHAHSHQHMSLLPRSCPQLQLRSPFFPLLYHAWW